MADSTQGEAADRDELRTLTCSGCRRDGEVEAIVTTDVAVEHVADMEAEVNRGHRPTRYSTPLVQGSDAPPQPGGTLERRVGMTQPDRQI